MALKKREKILAWTVGLLLAAVALQVVISSLGGPGGLRGSRDTLSGDVERMKNRLTIAAAANRKLDGWRERSLPSDPEVAQALYETWLRKLATAADFSDAKISYAGREHLKDVYYALRFRIRAKGSLDALTRFLHDFYRAGLLQKIDSLTITPRGGGTLTIQMTAEALSLAGATATDAMPEVDSKHKLATMDDYRRAIVDRNVFVPYEPPPGAPPPVETVDPLEFAELNTIVAVDGRPQAWINAKMSGDHYELFEGDEFQIGPARCKMLRIGQRDADVEIDGQRHRIAIGGNLRSGVAIPDGR